NGALMKQSGEASQVPSRRSNPGGATPLSAAERARMKRQSGGAAGGLKITWAEASPAKKAVMGGAVGLFVLGVLGGLGYAFWPKPNPNAHKIEPNQLGNTPIEASFGLGTD